MFSPSECDELICDLRVLEVSFLTLFHAYGSITLQLPCKSAWKELVERERSSQPLIVLATQAD